MIFKRKPPNLGNPIMNRAFFYFLHYAGYFDRCRSGHIQFGSTLPEKFRRYQNGRSYAPEIKKVSQ